MSHALIVVCDTGYILVALLTVLKAGGQRPPYKIGSR